MTVWKQLTIYISEVDRWQNKPLYLALVELAHQHGLMGITVNRAIAGFGKHHTIHTTQLLELSTNLPVIVTLIDQEQVINKFICLIENIVKDGFITLQTIEKIASIKGGILVGVNLSQIIENAGRYLAERQNPDGGFSSSEYLPESHPEDTFFAIAAWQIFHQDIPHLELVKKYLYQCLERLPPDHLYFTVNTWKILGEPFKIDTKIQENIINFIPSISTECEGKTHQNLLDILRETRLQKMLNQPSKNPEVIPFILELEHNAGWGLRPNLIDTCVSLAILKELDYPLETMNCTKQLLEKLQIPELGFTYTEDSFATSLDVLYAGVNACDLLQIEIKYKEDIIKFVSLCQGESGGFARVPLGIPDLEKTYRALKLLKQLFRNQSYYQTGESLP